MYALVLLWGQRNHCVGRGAAEKAHLILSLFASFPHPPLLPPLAANQLTFDYLM